MFRYELLHGVFHRLALFVLVLGVYSTVYPYPLLCMGLFMYEYRRGVNKLGWGFDIEEPGENEKSGDDNMCCESDTSKIMRDDLR